MCTVHRSQHAAAPKWRKSAVRANEGETIGSGKGCFDSRGQAKPGYARKEPTVDLRRTSERQRLLLPSPPRARTGASQGQPCANQPACQTNSIESPGNMICVWNIIPPRQLGPYLCPLFVDRSNSSPAHANEVLQWCCCTHVSSHRYRNNRRRGIDAAAYNIDNATRTRDCRPSPPFPP